MREHPCKKEFENAIIRLLTSFSDIESLLEPLTKVYAKYTDLLKVARPFEIELIPTESIRCSIFYQASPDMSESTIMIKHAKYDTYLWTDCDGWCLDDSYYKPLDIGAALSEVPLFNKVPENVRELKALIDEKYWGFDKHELPKFSDVGPSDFNEVLSWDKKFVLTGTCANNMEILELDEWESLCKREKSWFNE